MADFCQCFAVSGFAIFLYSLSEGVLCFRVTVLGRKLSGLPRLVAIVGGFMIMAGIILLGIAALATIGYLDAGMLLENKYLLAVATLMVAVGLLDTFSAVVIARW